MFFLKNFKNLFQIKYQKQKFFHKNFIMLDRQFYRIKYFFNELLYRYAKY